MTTRSKTMKFNPINLLRKQSALIHELPPREKLPRHIAFIMDGNGRWATRRGLPRSAGHAAGTEALREIIRTCSDIGIESMSIYAFSTENWGRSPEEVAALMRLISRYFASEIDELNEKNVKITIMGELDPFPEEQKTALVNAMAITKANTGLKLNIALNYGGRAEITRAARLLARNCVNGTLDPSDICDERLSEMMYTAGQADIDLLIRTGGDERVSNFMLWQGWYAELIFEKTYWPDYNKSILIKNLNEYASRERRFGKVKK